MTLEKAIEGIRDQNATGEVRLVKVLQTFTKFYNERRKQSSFSARAEGDWLFEDDETKINVFRELKQENLKLRKIGPILVGKSK